MSISYKQSGVQYNVLDPFKRLAQKKAGETVNNVPACGITQVAASRGESAFVWEESDCYRAFVVEGLGTKNLVADAMQDITGRSYYQAIAADSVAAIVNDLIVVGAKPQVVNAYFAVGDSDWVSDKKRASDLVTGWADACKRAGAIWGGGETPTLKDIIVPHAIDLAGSAIGIIKPKNRLTLDSKLAAGDAIVLVESSGIHANGLTLARAVVKKLPKGYKTPLSDGTLYGEAILRPTHIYAALVSDLFENAVDIHYMVNITGHGWRKLMRAKPSFSYMIDTIPPVPPIFTCIQKYSGTDDTEMYGNFNMGAGFALFVSEKDVPMIQTCASRHHIKIWHAGIVQKGPKQVCIRPKHITYDSRTLQVR